MGHLRRNPSQSLGEFDHRVARSAGWIAGYQAGQGATFQRRGDHTTELESAYRAELAVFRRARIEGARALARHSLERAHILSQPLLRLHLGSHGIMLIYAVTSCDWREAVGQVGRLLLAPLGELAGRIPIENTGRAGVNAFVPMPVPDDIRPILDRHGRRSAWPNRSALLSSE